MAVKVFFCYAKPDYQLLIRLKNHLITLQRQELIEVWYDRDINAGAEWEQEIASHLNTADLILLLISPYFMASDYCFSVEMMRAIERHERGEAVVIPIMLRPVDTEGAPFDKLQKLPRDSKPVISRAWLNADEAFSDIAQGIRKAISAPYIIPPRLTVPSRGESTLSNFVRTQQSSDQINILRDNPTQKRDVIESHKPKSIIFSDPPTYHNLDRELFSPAKSYSDSDRTILRIPPRRTQKGAARLYVIEGREQGRVFAIKKSLDIGRRPDNDIVLEDMEISRCHAFIHVDNAKNYVLKDNNSANGTVVNGQYLAQGQEYILKEGDQIQLGQTVLIFSQRYIEKQ